ncbi:hypothetical protein KGF56_004043 [Candida oxycetoniae]|uniref:non-specific serine/threonine protein kinase n=1 Tax=Candida oxycetoniae TaxID=497107 RepID=A0AAI9SUX3_9ASCO|nr:uncharacterized protein KGF56_004043 [Candida oxycetoniae]KAI3403154.2 hypothetical protein KGF56_004043 [Candida oxycetoniae]
MSSLSTSPVTTTNTTTTNNNTTTTTSTSTTETASGIQRHQLFHHLQPLFSNHLNPFHKSAENKNPGVPLPRGTTKQQPPCYADIHVDTMKDNNIQQLSQNPIDSTKNANGVKTRESSSCSPFSSPNDNILDYDHHQHQQHQVDTQHTTPSIPGLHVSTFEQQQQQEQEQTSNDDNNNNNGNARLKSPILEQSQQRLDRYGGVSSNNGFISPVFFHSAERSRSQSNTNLYSKPPTSKSGYSPPVKETTRVLLEYDPITRRKVLNTYEILKEIGRGEHGKVKLAKDLINNELVAIKIINRKSKRERPALRMRKDSKTPLINEYERKIKREIAIMKKCKHKHIVSLREVLDDATSLKIYLVLEYMGKGEIKWKKLQSDLLSKGKTYSFDDNITSSTTTTNSNSNSNGDNNSEEDIPCCGSGGGPRQPHHRLSSNNDEDLLSNEFSPNLTFRQSRKIFRDVLLGLEYLHMQGVVHRDIKPANLLVSSDNVVKISDFGVSFASSLSECEEGHLVNELDLAKTAGTPAFFAPELCQLDTGESGGEGDGESNDDRVPKSPKIDKRIDIWALGVTLYCLLFGKVPFNADTEYELFSVIVNKPLEFPKSISEFNSPSSVHEEEFELAKDLVSKMLRKNSQERITIKEIKEHPFTLMDLDDDMESLYDLFNLNSTNGYETPLDFNLEDHDIVSKNEIDNAVIGVGTRIKRNLVKAIKAGGLKDSEIKSKFHAMQLELSKSESSDESSSSYSNFNSAIKLNRLQNNYSVILSEQPITASASPLPLPLPLSLPVVNDSSTTTLTKNIPELHNHTPHIPSQLSHQVSTNSSSSISYQNPYSLTVPREGGKSILHEMIDSQNATSTSRRGSAGGVEAPQIETKRNVGGNLYLKNQSVLETFKGIQQEDDKRRRSSLFSVHLNSSNKSSTSNEVSSTNAATTSKSIFQSQDHVKTQSQVPPFQKESQTIVTPIPVPAVKPNFELIQYQMGRSDGQSDEQLSPTGNAGNNRNEPFLNTTVAKHLDLDDHLDTSFMSLPLTGSFASLDSINDDYLNMKYKEYENMIANGGTDSVFAKQMLRRKPSFSEADLGKCFPTNDINDRFRAFNLGEQMSSTYNKAKSSKREGGGGGTNNDEEEAENGIAPEIGNAKFFSQNSSCESYSSHTTDNASSSSSPSFSNKKSGNIIDDEEEDEESDEEDLTLAFRSKIAPANRPPFLSHATRAKSHDSHLPYLAGSTQRVDDVAPVIFHAGSPEFEDVPSALIGATLVANNSRSSQVINSGLAEVSPHSGVQKSVVEKNVSSIPSVSLPPPLARAVLSPSLPVAAAAAASAASLSIKPASIENLKESNKKSIEARQNNLKQQQSNLHKQLFRQHIYNYQFNNHYNKAPIFSHFPNATKHLDNDHQVIVETSARKFQENRPSYYRSNSVAVGVLQHTPDEMVKDMIEERRESNNGCDETSKKKEQ